MSKPALPSLNIDKATMAALMNAAGLAAAGPAAHVADVVYHGDKLVLPEGMAIPDAVKLLERKQKYLEEEVSISEAFDVFPWDGAYALDAVLTRRFGWVAAEATPGFFGNKPPELRTIDIGPGVKRKIPWGRLSMPGMNGFIATGATMVRDRVCFSFHAVVTRKDEATIQAIVEDLREYLKTNSIYRGQAIKIRFRDEDGDKLSMPEPEFMDTSRINRSQLIYSEDVTRAVEVNLFTPVERMQDCIANGIPVKRGVLLGGTYGTGKTMAATVASKLAVDNGITYIYVPRADELADAVNFAKQYQTPNSGCVIFCEDIDRVMAGERSIEMDDILNIIDGIDTKHANIITVLTTNDLRSINPAMLRPGRLDAVIEVTPPDAKAVEKLVRFYGADTIDPNADLTAVGVLMAGNIPAVIAEMVKRAKLAQLNLQPRGEKVSLISQAALIDAANTMQSQLTLLRERCMPQTPAITLDTVFEAIVERALGDRADATLKGTNKLIEMHS